MHWISAYVLYCKVILSVCGCTKGSQDIAEININDHNLLDMIVHGNEENLNTLYSIIGGEISHSGIMAPEALCLANLSGWWGVDASNEGRVISLPGNEGRIMSFWSGDEFLVG